MYKICKEFHVDYEYFILDEPLDKTESNQGKIAENTTDFYENIMEQIKTLIEDCKQKEFQIKQLEAKILFLQKQI